MKDEGKLSRNKSKGSLPKLTPKIEKLKLELKKIFIDMIEAKQLYIDTYGVYGQIKRPRDGADADQDTLRGTDGVQKRRSGKKKNPLSTSAPKMNRQPQMQEKDYTTGSKTPSNLLANLLR
ncbi:hypothetical protein Tco_0785420 [Tanacetum coccineum]